MTRRRSSSTVYAGDAADEPVARPLEDALADPADAVDHNYAVDPADYPVTQLAQEDVDRALADVAPPAPVAGPGPATAAEQTPDLPDDGAADDPPDEG